MVASSPTLPNPANPRTYVSRPPFTVFYRCPCVFRVSLVVFSNRLIDPKNINGGVRFGVSRMERQVELEERMPAEVRSGLLFRQTLMLASLVLWRCV